MPLSLGDGEKEKERKKERKRGGEREIDKQIGTDTTTRPKDVKLVSVMKVFHPLTGRHVG